MPADTPTLRTPQWTLYQRAVVDIELPEGTVRVAPAAPGVAVGPFPAPHVATIHIVTAHNPGGGSVSRQDNDRAHQELLGLLRRRGLPFWPAVGGDADGRYTEDSAAIVGISDHEACVLGQQFGQDAVFAWSATTWRLLSCSGAEEAPTRGWQATRRSPQD
ncbi:DUF3293 domain-containing protein [Streptomyces sp. NPDC050743]|uniref:DUF3293 domain-containing protein n=1 Tax=Streptomyces sp. NPDC050743 TaxID=3365634 RepID=UPI00378EF49D